MNTTQTEYSMLIHSGVAHDDDPPGRGSGRYGWGTGENPGQHQFSFISEVNRLRRDGLKDSEIAKIMLGEKAKGTDLKAELSIAKKAERKANIQRALSTLDECNGNHSEAARRMGLSTSSFNSLIDPAIAERTSKYENTAAMIKKVVDEKGFVDVGRDIGLYLGCTDNTKDVAVKMLEKEGYVKGYVKIPQLGTSHETSVVVLAKPGTTQSEIQQNKYKIAPITEFTPDKGKTWFTPEYPSSLDSKRVMIRYGDEGGKEKDGVIELRRGVTDLSLGDAQYAQVRIAVDGDHYMKGMAMYALDADMPKGIDVIYNTNKKSGTPFNDVLKPMKTYEGTDEINKENPFGALIKAGGQYHYTDENGKDQLSPINKLREEGEWDSWSRTIASQMLSKQPMKVINQQLNISISDKRLELEKIMNLTNPVIKKKLLDDFANSCDANATDLSAKGFKNQSFQVLLPITSLKDNEIYAPRFKDGDTVALIRYPHGGIFEIPVLTVNNKHKQAKEILRDAADAVGINSTVAEQLSGADFDGDTAVVVPLKSNQLGLSHRKPYKELQEFDPKMYKLPDSAPSVSSSTKEIEMGKVTNLITDMTALGANPDEIIRAVKHSMVVIDSEKHHLDYRKSYEDNRIRELKVKYQGVVNPDTGRINTPASTILSKASSEEYVPQRKEVTDVKKMTDAERARWDAGMKVYQPTGKTKMKYISDPKEMTPEELTRYKAGKKVYRETTEVATEKVARMDLVDDAMDLVYNKDNEKEVAYAKYANDLKDMARTARRESRGIKPTPVDKKAKEAYAPEVAALNAKINQAKSNSPKERRAQDLGNAYFAEALRDNPGMDKEHRDREKARCINKARAEVGARKDKIEITDREWEAIQNNAISTNKLTYIVNNTNLDVLKQRATPKGTSKGLSSGEIAKLKAMYASGMYTQAEIAKSLGVSVSTVSSALKAA